MIHPPACSRTPFFHHDNEVARARNAHPVSGSRCRHDTRPSRSRFVGCTTTFCTPSENRGRVVRPGRQRGATARDPRNGLFISPGDIDLSRRHRIVDDSIRPIACCSFTTESCWDTATESTGPRVLPLRWRIFTGIWQPFQPARSLATVQRTYRELPPRFGSAAWVPLPDNTPLALQHRRCPCG